MVKQVIKNSIKQASSRIGKVWPLYSFVTSNPLAGYQNLNFHDAVGKVNKLLGANGYPAARFFRQAWNKGEINKEILNRMLEGQLMFQTPEYYLEEMEAWEQKLPQIPNPDHDLDLLVIKWMSAFMDEGMAAWSMPGREKGFYNAWRNLVVFDHDLENKHLLKHLPEDNMEAISLAITGYAFDSYTEIFLHHLMALPGWTGYIKYRSDEKTAWQETNPVTIADYLAVRLTLARHLGKSILPGKRHHDYQPIAELQKIWLAAWERSWQSNTISGLKLAMENTLNSGEEDNSSPVAQLVFCIDTRSEVIRRHIEQQGNYETFGYAGFFGIPMDHSGYNSGIRRKSCPPIVDSQYHIHEKPAGHESVAEYHRKNGLLEAVNDVVRTLKKNIPASFGFVEGAGLMYGAYLFSRTFLPGRIYRGILQLREFLPGWEGHCEPQLQHIHKEPENMHALAPEEKALIVKSAFDLMGWEKFSPLVVLVGHGSHTTNNPFGSSLDCGACAASPGRHNARAFAALANDQKVRQVLNQDHQLNIPADTYFIAAEHNTTTDEVLLFDHAVPASHRPYLTQLKEDLFEAGKGATSERLGVNAQNDLHVARKAADWAETRPEWGLAGNAGFIVGPRSITKNMDLEGRFFLHSYNWQNDPDGQFLEGILKGPMVVTQWINNHYYFATVDNNRFGSGSKITQNITGKFGVVQGNGGDLKTGLPLQSLQKTDDEMYHKPLRLTVFIHAPVDRVEKILENNSSDLLRLIENEWIYLCVIDPEQDNHAMMYQGNMEWKPKSGRLREISEVSVVHSNGRSRAKAEA